MELCFTTFCAPVSSPNWLISERVYSVNQKQALHLQVLNAPEGLVSDLFFLMGPPLLIKLIQTKPPNAAWVNASSLHTSTEPADAPLGARSDPHSLLPASLLLLLLSGLSALLLLLLLMLMLLAAVRGRSLDPSEDLQMETWGEQGCRERGGRME